VFSCYGSSASHVQPAESDAWAGQRIVEVSFAGLSHGAGAYLCESVRVWSATDWHP
jgi:hypothetical protein